MSTFKKNYKVLWILVPVLNYNTKDLKRYRGAEETIRTEQAKLEPNPRK